MLEDHLKSPAVVRRLRSGPIAPYVDAFADWRHRLGYQPISIVGQLQFAATWSDWMRDSGFTTATLASGLGAYKEALSREGRFRYSNGKLNNAVVACRSR
jgi:hypothetical protein